MSLFTGRSNHRVAETCPVLGREFERISNGAQESASEIIKDAIEAALAVAKEKGTYLLREALDECQQELDEALEKIEELESKVADRDNEVSLLQAEKEKLERQLSKAEAELAEL